MKWELDLETDSGKFMIGKNVGSIELWLIKDIMKNWMAFLMS